MYYTYILRCEDNSLYTGITTDLERRLEEHKNQGEKCAKYTLRHNAKNFESAWKSENRKLASKLEYHIKTLSKSKKEELIIKNNLQELLGEKIEAENYVKCKI